MDELRLDVSQFAGGRLKHFFHVWEGLTSDGEILQLVKGVKLDFVDDAELPAVQPAQPRLNHKERKIIHSEIQKLAGKKSSHLVKPGQIKSCLLSLQDRKKTVHIG